MVEFIKKLKQKLLKKYRSGELVRQYYSNELKLEYRRKPSEKEFLKEYATYDYTAPYAVFEESDYRNIGKQKVFAGVRFDDFFEMLEFIGKKKEFLRFEKLLGKDWDLVEFLKSNPKILLDNMDIWEKVLEVKGFFVKNPKPDVYVRELPVAGIDTKFIEKNKKVLDRVLSQFCEYNENVQSISGKWEFEKKYFLKHPKERIRIKNREWDDIEINTDDLSKFREKKLFVIENLYTYLAFPVCEGYLTVFGRGFNAAVLKNFDYEVVYWGDIDKAGFAILSMVRNFAQTKSFLMDLETFEKFSSLSVEDNERDYSNLNLTEEEMKCYNFIKSGNRRLEQERIPFGYVLEKLKDVL